MPFSKQEETIRLAHGGGGSLTQALVRDVFLAAFGDSELARLNDSALIDVPAGRVAFTTDSFVVQPLFFPGGDIGRLAVCGTVNDLAVTGAVPVAISAGFILEEGLAVGDLKRIVRSMSDAAAEAGVRIVTGDTKVVQKGKGDGVFINTAGIGVFPEGRAPVTGSGARPGDAVIVSGPLGRHGMAVVLAREDLGLSSGILSDAAPLNGMIQAALSAHPGLHAMRDATRGGLGVVLNEIAEQSGVGIELEEDRIPVPEDVRSACEILGFDALYVANEGVVAACVAREHADAWVRALAESRYGKQAAVIGRVTEKSRHRVVLRTRIGSRRIVDVISGEQLPRIC
ncbi:MAG: hydrogenase expression/formation protein HypE [bacterium]|nr:hydrogenase expression/formation protein HypE [bacterium]